MTIDDSEIDRLLAAANPVPDGHGTVRDPQLFLANIIGSSTGVAAITARSEQRKLTTKHLPRRAVAVATAVAIAAAGGTAAAVSSQTSWVDADTTNFGATVHAAGQGIPFPPSDGTQNYATTAFKGAGEMTVDGVRFTLAIDASCAWQGYWLLSRTRNDATARTHAAAVLRAVPSWEAITKQSDNGTVLFFRRVAAAASADEPALVRQAWQANCTDLPRRWASK